MKRYFMMAALAGAAMVLPMVTVSAAEDYTPKLNDLAKGAIRQFAEDPALVSAIVAQNAVTAAYDQAKIDALDKQWRAEVDAADKPLIPMLLDLL